MNFKKSALGAWAQQRTNIDNYLELQDNLKEMGMRKELSKQKMEKAHEPVLAR